MRWNDVDVNILAQAIKEHGVDHLDWDVIAAKYFPNKRTPEQCRFRWNMYLRNRSWKGTESYQKELTAADKEIMKNFCVTSTSKKINHAKPAQQQWQKEKIVKKQDDPFWDRGVVAHRKIMDMALMGLPKDLRFKFRSRQQPLSFYDDTGATDSFVANLKEISYKRARNSDIVSPDNIMSHRATAKLLLDPPLSPTNFMPRAANPAQPLLDPPGMPAATNDPVQFLLDPPGTRVGEVSQESARRCEDIAVSTSSQEFGGEEDEQEKHDHSTVLGESMEEELAPLDSFPLRGFWTNSLESDDASSLLSCPPPLLDSFPLVSPRRSDDESSSSYLYDVKEDPPVESDDEASSSYLVEHSPEDRPDPPEEDDSLPCLAVEEVSPEASWDKKSVLELEPEEATPGRNDDPRLLAILMDWEADDKQSREEQTGSVKNNDMGPLQKQTPQGSQSQRAKILMDWEADDKQPREEQIGPVKKNDTEPLQKQTPQVSQSQRAKIQMDWEADDKQPGQEEGVLVQDNDMVAPEESVPEATTAPIQLVPPTEQSNAPGPLGALSVIDRALSVSRSVLHEHTVGAKRPIQLVAPTQQSDIGESHEAVAALASAQSSQESHHSPRSKKRRRTQPLVVPLAGIRSVAKLEQMMAEEMAEEPTLQEENVEAPAKSLSLTFCICIPGSLPQEDSVVFPEKPVPNQISLDGLVVDFSVDEV